MKCTACGADIPDEYKFCGNCGHKIAKQDEELVNTLKRILSLIGIVVLVVVAVVVIAIGIYLVADGLVLVTNSQNVSSLYGHEFSSWDTNLLQRAIAEVIAGSILIILAANYLIVKTVVSNGIRRLKRQISSKL